ncbi:MAG: GyrI-like domain-containing protein [Mucilaginibacter sp.]
MQYILADQGSFFVAGIAVRTTNQDDKANKDIGDLWTKFMSEDIQSKISDKYSDDLYCVYTDYETDHTGWYTAVIGCRVLNAGNDGMFIALVPSGSYRLYKPEGKFPDCVAETWRTIWLDGYNRKYIADYDLYKAGAKSFKETETEIYVGVV